MSLLLWILTPYLIFVAAFTGATLFGESPTQSDRREALIYYGLAGFTGLIAPFGALIIGIWICSRTVKVIAMIELCISLGFIALMVTGAIFQ